MNLGGERFVIPIAGPIEVGLEHHCRVGGLRGLQLFARGPGALEGRAGQQRCGVPADALPSEARTRVVGINARAQRALPHILQAAEAARGVDKLRGEVIRAPR